MLLLCSLEAKVQRVPAMKPSRTLKPSIQEWGCPAESNRARTSTAVVYGFRAAGVTLCWRWAGLEDRLCWGQPVLGRRQAVLGSQAVLE